MLMDVDGVGLGHFSAAVRAYVKEIAARTRVLFPETLHLTVVAGAPWLVSRAVWPMVKNFLHVVTQQKFRFVSATEQLADLADLEALPPCLGGLCRCEECVSGAFLGGSMRTWEEGCVAATVPPANDPATLLASLL